MLRLLLAGLPFVGGSSKESFVSFVSRVFADEHKTVIRKTPKELSKAGASVAASLALEGIARTQHQETHIEVAEVGSRPEPSAHKHGPGDESGSAGSEPVVSKANSTLTSGEGRYSVLLILVDQWRYSAFSAVPFKIRDFGVRTPQLDKLAAESVVFQRAFTSNPVCTPARASLLTGRYSHQHGLYTTNIGLPRGEVTLASVLSKVGYQTFYQGKWHLDGDPSPGFVPKGWRRFGFDTFEGFNRGHRYFDGSYFTDAGKEEALPGNVFEPKFQVNRAIESFKALSKYVTKKTERKKGHTDDAEGQVDSLRLEGTQHPWFYMISLGPPHDPFVPPPRFMNHQRKIRWRPNVNVSTLPLPVERRAGDRMGHRARAGALQAAETDYRGYLGLCEAVDFEVGRLLEGLEKYGHDDSTLVIFTSDHGDMM